MGMVKAEKFGLYDVSEKEGVEQLAVVVSPDELNESLNTVVILPLFPVISSAPFRIAIEFKGTSGEIAVEKIMSVPKARLKKMVGFLPESLAVQVSEVLQEMFSL